MLKNVGAFLIVWSVWSFLDLTILSSRTRGSTRAAASACSIVMPTW